jgi:hypothetical protein
MATPLTKTQTQKYDWAAPSNLTRTEKATYPWDEWLDGRTWRLTQGEDFFPHPLMMERIIRTRATGRGAKVRLRHEPLDASDTRNPFGIIVLQRTDVEYEWPVRSTNGQRAAKAPATKAAPAKSNGTKTAAKKAPAAKATTKAPAKKAPAAKTTKATIEAPTKAAKKAAPARKTGPASKAPAKPSKRASKPA